MTSFILAAGIFLGEVLKYASAEDKEYFFCTTNEYFKNYILSGQENLSLLNSLAEKKDSVANNKNNVEIFKTIIGDPKSRCRKLDVNSHLGKFFDDKDDFEKEFTDIFKGKSGLPENLLGEGYLLHSRLQFFVCFLSLLFKTFMEDEDIFKTVQSQPWADNALPLRQSLLLKFEPKESFSTSQTRQVSVLEELQNKIRELSPVFSRSFRENTRSGSKKERLTDPPTQTFLSPRRLAGSWPQGNIFTPAAAPAVDNSRDREITLRDIMLHIDKETARREAWQVEENTHQRRRISQMEAQLAAKADERTIISALQAAVAMEVREAMSALQLSGTTKAQNQPPLRDQHIQVMLEACRSGELSPGNEDCEENYFLLVQNLLQSCPPNNDKARWEARTLARVAFQDPAAFISSYALSEHANSKGKAGGGVGRGDGMASTRSRQGGGALAGAGGQSCAPRDDFLLPHTSHDFNSNNQALGPHPQLSVAALRESTGEEKLSRTQKKNRKKRAKAKEGPREDGKLSDSGSSASENGTCGSGREGGRQAVVDDFWVDDLRSESSSDSQHAREEILQELQYDWDQSKPCHLELVSSLMCSDRGMTGVCINGDIGRLKLDKKRRKMVFILDYTAKGRARRTGTSRDASAIGQPLSRAQWTPWFEGQLAACKGKPSWMENLIDYGVWMSRKMTDLMGTDPSATGDHHLTLWAVFFVFHLNMWNAATAHSDPTRLKTGRDTLWETHFKELTKEHSNPALDVPVSQALEVLGYCCSNPRCGVGGVDGFCHTCPPTLSTSSKATMLTKLAWEGNCRIPSTNQKGREAGWKLYQTEQKASPLHSPAGSWSALARNQSRIPQHAPDGRR